MSRKPLSWPYIPGEKMARLCWAGRYLLEKPAALQKILNSETSGRASRSKFEFVGT